MNQGRVRVPLESRCADNALHSLRVHPVLDVLHGLVHTQEDGLMAVVQTRGGTLCAYAVSTGALQLQVAVELRGQSTLALHLPAEMKGAAPGAILPAVNHIASTARLTVIIFTFDPALAVELETIGALVEPMELGRWRVTRNRHTSTWQPRAILGALDLKGPLSCFSGGSRDMVTWFAFVLAK